MVQVKTNKKNCKLLEGSEFDVKMRVEHYSNRTTFDGKDRYKNPCYWCAQSCVSRTISQSEEFLTKPAFEIVGKSIY